jgi:hypothetical protein
MSTLKAENITKYDAGGAGDNIIADGYIKTVEKIWLDRYTLVVSGQIPSNSTLDIARIPENKKITGIDIFFPASFSGAAATGTGTTISIGARTTGLSTNVTASTLFLNAGECLTATTMLSANTNAGIGYVTTGGANVIFLQFGRLATTITAGYITSIVRYT